MPTDQTSDVVPPLPRRLSFTVLRTSSLSVREPLACMLVGSAIFVVVELEKLITRHLGRPCPTKCLAPGPRQATVRPRVP